MGCRRPRSLVERRPTSQALVSLAGRTAFPERHHISTNIPQTSRTFSCWTELRANRIHWSAPSTASTALRRSGKRRRCSRIRHLEVIIASQRPARIVVHDYLGHPFQIELSRELARRGHDVRHVHCSTIAVGQGKLQVGEPDSGRLSIIGVPQQQNPISGPDTYGQDVGSLIGDFAPHVVISGNSPVPVQRDIQQTCAQWRIRFVYWLQDVYSARAPSVKTRPDDWERTARCEKATLLSSDAVVAIAEPFADFVRQCGVQPEHITVIENWAPLAEMECDSDDWAPASSYHSSGEPIFLYSGTLDDRHGADLLVRLAKACDARNTGVLIVVSEGSGRRALESARALGIRRLQLYDFQPYEHVPRMFAAADVLLAGLSTEAGQMSVPSKVLAYLCAGRPVLAAIPSTNRAAQLLAEIGAGQVVSPDDPDKYVEAAFALLADPARRLRMGSAGRQYARRAFAIEPIADRFEEILVP
ncbi:glycosyltransferase family 4 protein [Saccharopolyspora spinosa]|uniref:Glycosyltransferase involved in cell wall biosynthesis n=1 Tax=Saccharopolyspora spinosa TaxID=60894 RepID=A0A2N3Y4U5_SACSN|nr:glycosyltransferase family 4 protein [Saccharopolyspora spinosa]PKW17956.1 glycosyltransferase involved in cell wall biosynthesis [Saccharopolyspora spinosa]